MTDIQGTGKHRDKTDTEPRLPSKRYAPRHSAPKGVKSYSER